MVGEGRSLVSFVGDRVVDIQIQAGVGEDQAKQVRDDFLVLLMAEFGGRRVWVHSLQKLNRSKIADGWRNGRTIRQLALDFDVTERYVYSVVAGL